MGRIRCGREAVASILPQLHRSVKAQIGLAERVEVRGRGSGQLARPVSPAAQAHQTHAVDVLAGAVVGGVVQIHQPQVVPQLMAHGAYGGHQRTARPGIIVVNVLLVHARRRHAHVFDGHGVLVQLHAVHPDAQNIVSRPAARVLPFRIDDRAVGPRARLSIRLVVAVHRGVQARQHQHDGQLRRVDAPVAVRIVGGKIHRVLHRRHCVGEQRRRVMDCVVPAVRAMIDARRQAPGQTAVPRADDGQLRRHDAVVGRATAFLRPEVGKDAVGVLLVVGRKPRIFAENHVPPLGLREAALHVGVVHAHHKQRNRVPPRSIGRGRGIAAVLRHSAAERVILMSGIHIMSGQRGVTGLILLYQGRGPGRRNLLQQRLQPAFQLRISAHDRCSADIRIAVFRNEVAAQRKAVLPVDHIAQASGCVHDDHALHRVHRVGKALVAPQVALDGFARARILNGHRPRKRRHSQRMQRRAEQRQNDRRPDPLLQLHVILPQLRLLFIRRWYRGG